MLFHPECIEIESASNDKQTSTPNADVRNQSITLSRSFGGMFGSGGGVSVTSVVGGPSSASSSISSSSNSSSSIVSPSPSRSAIKEANDHLQLLHQRVQELERTVREQAEALIKKDECMQSRLRDLAQAKDARIAELSRALEQSNEHVQRLEQACRDRDLQMEETNRRNAEELGSYVPVLERLVTSLQRTSTSSTSQRHWATNHAVNHQNFYQPSPAGNDQNFLLGSTSAIKQSGYAIGSMPNNRRARKLFKGSGDGGGGGVPRQDLRLHLTSMDSGVERPISSSSARGQMVSSDIKIGRSFNINSNFSMSEDGGDDDDDVEVENNA